MTNFGKTKSVTFPIDWTILTAGLVGLGLAVMTLATDGFGNAAIAPDRSAVDRTVQVYHF